MGADYINEQSQQLLQNFNIKPTDNMIADCLNTTLEYIEALISEFQVFEERQRSSQWLKSIKSKLPIIGDDVSIGSDNETHVEVICLMEKV